MALFLTQLKDLYIKAKGFHTNRKLIVFESDDWGSIRMPSREVFEKLKATGDSPEADAFLSNDCLENEEDILSLFVVLNSVHDSKGNSPIFTMNFAMANPNFEKIDFDHNIYVNEPFYETYRKYYGGNKILDIIKDGYKNKLILPQLHCREHLNVGRWMHNLKEHHADAVLAFNNKTLGVGSSFNSTNKFGYMDAFNTDFSSDEELFRILADAVTMFNNTFEYHSASFVASCFVWNDCLEEFLKNNNIYYIQSASWQNKPIGKNGIYRLKRVLHYTGQKNKNNQIYSVRNCNFEPAYHQNPQDCVQSCLNEISNAFKSKKPAIINSHRFNYIGSINPQNRKNNLLGLETLLNAIIEQYSDVEFISSVDLFNIMTQERR